MLAETKENVKSPNTENTLPKWLKIFSFATLTSLITILGITIKSCSDLEDLKFKETNNVKEILTSMVTKDASIMNKELFLATLYNAYKGNDETNIFSFYKSQDKHERYDLVLDFSEIFIIDLFRNPTDSLISEKHLFFYKKIIQRIDSNYFVSIFKKLNEIYGGKVIDENRIISNQDTKSTITNSNDILKKNSETVTTILGNWICYIQIDNNFEKSIETNDSCRNKLSNFIGELKDRNAIVPKLEIIDKDFKNINDIRYFYLDDLSFAEKARDMLKNSGIDASINFLPKYRDKVPKRQIEVWISKCN